MPNSQRTPVLEGRKALVVGIANEHSIAYGCASAFRQLGADAAVAYVNEKTRGYVAPLAEALEAKIRIVPYLATPYAHRITGKTMCVDGGVNIMA